MQKRRSGNFLRGAFILTAATMVVKVISMFYKIPLGNILGAGGMSYFMSAYSIFNPIYALSVAGFPVAVSKMVSENLAQKRYRDMRRIRRVSMLLFFVIGLCGMLLMLLGAKWFAGRIGNPGAAPAIAAIAPALFFCCIVSAWRGYYQGLQDMTPTALSQVIEAVVKLAAGVALALFFLNRGMAQYAAGGTVFGTVAESEGQAQMLALPFAAAGAVLGVTLSTAVGALYLWVVSLVRKDGITQEELKAAPAPRTSSAIVKTLLRVALPVCLAAAVTHISTLIDAVSIINRIGVAMQRDSVAVLAQYAHLLPQELAYADVPSYLYGAFTYTSSLLNLVPAITVALGISALPALSSDWALGKRKQAAVRVRSVLKLSALCSIPAGLGLSVLAQPILALLYPNLTAEVAIAAPLLRTIGLAAVFLGVTTPMMSVFQAVGRTMVPVRLMLGGAILKAVSNYILLAIPSVNVNAAPVGTILCYSFIFVAGLVSLRRTLGVELDVARTFIKPLICGVLCAVAAGVSFSLLSLVWQSRLVVLVSVGIGAVIYAIFILFLKIITKNEALMLPNGKKIAKILEKLCFLG